MITWLTGDNSYEIRQALKVIEATFRGTPESKDATELNLSDLPELLMGTSLFSTERLIIIRDITQNSNLWEKLPNWLPRLSDSIYLVFIDTKPDKRTTSYKALKAAADHQEYPAWTDRDTARAEAWTMEQFKQAGAAQPRPVVSHLVRRVGPDQWQLANAVNMLSLLDTVTTDAIDEVIAADPTENIFQLFETALQGDARGVQQSIQTLALQEDPYGLFALLSLQAMSLAAVSFADASASPAKDFAIHPFVAGKLARYSSKLGKAKVAHIVELFAVADADMKRSKATPWLLVERLLLRVAQVSR